MRWLRWWLGAVLVALGGLWLLDVAGLLSAGTVIARWWPLAVIALGLLAMISERRLAAGPVVVLLVGLALLAGELTPAGLAGIIWPVLAVTLGAWLLLDYTHRRGRGSRSTERQDVFALLGGSHTTNRSSSFSHADVSAVFGGATLDLRDATPAPGAQVDALALFGGVEVIVPDGWRIELSGLPIFGGYQDKTVGRGGPSAEAPELRVVATAIFGGVEVKNPPIDAPAAVPTSTAANTAGVDLR